jgi:Mrp family chromosome partitioning ATPase
MIKESRNLSAESRNAQIEMRNKEIAETLRHIKNKILVMSGKGGLGK